MESFYARYGKRCLECLIAGLCLILLSPFFGLIAILIRLDSPGRIFFLQERIGQFAIPFKMYKFRTMRAQTAQNGSLISTVNDTRITKIGRFLRKSKLDEIPQLINVLKGEMSIVGPRPEVLSYVIKHQADFVPVLHLRPGLTDYAFLSFPQEACVLADFSDHEDSYDNMILPLKLRLYWKYLREISLFTDIKIWFKSFLVLLFEDYAPRAVLPGKTHFGEIAIELGYLRQASLRQALQQQERLNRSSWKPIGQILLETGDLREPELGQVLAYQQFALKIVRA
jgi:lipopolysaccharide/colanic/teichoic acid biosynthesis glycosyltransferase